MLSPGRGRRHHAWVLAQLLRESGAAAEAEAALDVALANGPTAHLHLARARLRLGREAWERAIADCARALDLGGDEGAVLVVRGRARRGLLADEPDARGALRQDLRALRGGG